MSLSTSQSEAQLLENYQLALSNAETNPEIAATMALFGYDAVKIAEGKAVLASTHQAYNFNKQEDQESLESRVNFLTLFNQVFAIYKLNRRKAKVVFRKDAVAYSNLLLTGQMPRNYAKRLDLMSLFYERIQANLDIQTQLARLAITPEEIVAALAALVEVQAAHNTYQNEIGESQDATKIKNAAFEAIEDWMNEFYAVSKIAMEDHPQLLESLGVFIRS